MESVRNTKTFWEYWSQRLVGRPVGTSKFHAAPGSPGPRHESRSTPAHRCEEFPRSDRQSLRPRQPRQLRTMGSQAAAGVDEAPTRERAELRRSPVNSNELVGRQKSAPVSHPQTQRATARPPRASPTASAAPRTRRGARRRGDSPRSTRRPTATSAARRRATTSSGAPPSAARAPRRRTSWRRCTARSPPR